MKSKAILQTFTSRFLFLIFNFLLIIITTNIWGSEGKGVISLVIADLSIISFVSNVFVGGSVSYFSNRYPSFSVIGIGYLWSIVVGFFATIFVNIIGYSSINPFLFLALTVVMSLFNANASFFIGKQKMNLYNTFSIIQLVLHVLLLLGVVFILEYNSVNQYFVTQLLCYAILFLVTGTFIWKKLDLNSILFYKVLIYKMFNYGWKNQISGFIQFLNYRLSFYFLEFFKGFSSLGVFSVGVALSEAIWVISRSMSVLLYSNVVNEKNKLIAVETTKTAIKICFNGTLLLLIILILVPSSLYSWIFGSDFKDVKTIIYILSPGILFLAISNVVGHYFSGTNQLKILTIKSMLGLLVTVVFSILFIPKLGILGACLSTSCSYMVSSMVLLFKFYKETSFSLHDYFFSRKDLQKLFKTVKKG